TPYELPTRLVGSEMCIRDRTMLAGSVDPELLYPPVSPLTWPQLTPLMLLAVGVAAAPAWLAPPPPPTVRAGRPPAVDRPIPVTDVPADGVRAARASTPGDRP
ncbi:hypothetical protein DLJ57_17130, partial [Micromonospora chalcea]